MKPGGKIIAIVGAPRSGKSFLAKRLVEHYGGRAFLEGEEIDFPARIKEDITKNIRPLERVLWYRNKLVEKYRVALRHKQEGELVILDTFWVSYQLFIDALAAWLERTLLHDVASIDIKSLGWPDLTVFLNISERGMRKFIALGGRSFDRSEEFIKNQALPVNTLHQKFFSRFKHRGEVFIINRGSLDFVKQRDFEKLVWMI